MLGVYGTRNNWLLREVSQQELGGSKLESEAASVLGSGFLKNALAMMLDFQKIHTNTKDTYKISKVFTTTSITNAYFIGVVLNLMNIQI